MTGWNDNLTRTPLPAEQHEAALTALAARLSAVQDQLRQLSEAETALKTSIRQLAIAPGRYQAGDLQIVVTQNRRFNEAAARRLITEDLHPLVTKEPALDSAKVRTLFPDIWEQAQDHYDDKISLDYRPDR